MLVATTIIESGIDNPHTNTLIIEDCPAPADWRSCTSSRGAWDARRLQAYAYFMFPEHVSFRSRPRPRSASWQSGSTPT